MRTIPEVKHVVLLGVLDAQKEDDDARVPLVLVPQVLDDVVKLPVVGRVRDFLCGRDADVARPRLFVERVYSRLTCTKDKIPALH